MRDKLFREQQRALKRERKDQRKELRHQRVGQFFGKKKRSSSVLAGFVLLCIGTVLLLKEFGVDFPAWLFTWPMIIITFGVFAGAGNSFRDPGWLIISGVGTVFLLDKIWPEIPIHHFIWPVLIIVLGFIIIMAPRRHRLWHSKVDENLQKSEALKDEIHATINSTIQENTQEAILAKRDKGNWLDIVSIFGNIKKMVYSKDFKGGDIVCIFGGAEINLMQTDFEGKIVIELVQIFGGAKIIVPPHWQIRSEMVAVFGGIEDKRAPQTNYDTNKIVVLNGTTFFGGIEIRSY